jgi:hypothetical protein
VQNVYFAANKQIGTWYRVEVLPPAPRALDLAEQELVVLRAADEIERLGVDDQERRRVVVQEEARVGIGDAFQVAALDQRLVADPATRDALHQHVDGRLQVDDEIGPGRIDRELGVHLFVERVLLVIERHTREQPILVEQVVGDAHRIEQVLLPELLELARALEEKEELRREGCGARVAVEALEERILLGLLEDQLAAEALRQPAREVGLADADRPFDHDETMHRRCRHGCLNLREVNSASADPLRARGASVPRSPACAPARRPARDRE